GTFSECELKRAIIKKTRQKILLMDSSKLERSMPFTFARMNDIDIFVTDGNILPGVLKEAESCSVLVL
ncbi:MAG TPA: DeoR/GlpR transcriptional regulator, partial [Clostridia bacterium]|nr:DeoR/GlpR transcriptional regulator [Clostridia bacterium]